MSSVQFRFVFGGGHLGIEGPWLAWVKLLMPRSVRRHDDRFGLIEKLVGSDVHDDFPLPKPAVRVAFSLTRYVVKRAKARFSQVTPE